MSRVAIVTGASGGIGKCGALCLVKAGCTVYDLSRRDYKQEGIIHIGTDVTDEDAVKAAVEQVLREQGRIDILVNNAGYGISGAFEFTRNEDFKRLMDVNVFGTANCIKAVLPQMRFRGSGHIVNVSSVAAPLPIPFQTWYSCSKAAIKAMTMAVANEVKPFGISVCCVMPGDTSTGFTSARNKSNAGDAEYKGRISKSVEKMEKDEQNGMSAQRAGEFIARLALKSNPAPYNTIGLSYKLFVLLERLLPGRFIRFMLGKLYG